MTGGAARAAKGAAKKDYGVLEYAGQEFKIVRKPPTLLLAELGNVSTGDPGAIGALAEFFKVVLGEGYLEFKKAMYYAEEEPDEDVLSELMSKVLEATVGRSGN